MFCDVHALWFADYTAERGRVVVAKFTTAGDQEDGFLTFDWVINTQAGASDRHVRRVMKVRVREPR